MVQTFSKLTWFPGGVPPALAAALRTLSGEYPLTENPDGIPVHFRSGNELVVEHDSAGWTITFDTQSAALKGVGLVLAGIETRGEKCPFDLFGIMLDCSRNAVMTVPYAKQVLRRLALAGYNTVMLYTEDTYHLPDEPHFGFLRGAYSLEEIRELDDYAFTLGIEIIGCIQTLGHLATFLKYAGSASVKDTASVLLAEEEKTYALIRKMLSFWGRACRSRRIHIGMDETHDLGRGKYMDRHGWKKNSGIFTTHLQRVSALCKEAGLTPMIWSDMFFCMGSQKNDYYDLEVEIPAAVREGLPGAVDLVYWDYYHKEESFYNRMIEIHRSFHRDPLVASGIWTWYRLIYDHLQTVERVAPCIDSCRKNRIRKFIFTMWGDDGAYCDFDTAFAGILWSSDYAYGTGCVDGKRLNCIAKALHCRSFEQALEASKMNWQCPHRDNGVGTLSLLLWDDPLLGFGWRIMRLDDPEMQRAFRLSLQSGLAPLDDYPYAAAIRRLLRCKLEFQIRLKEAFRCRDARLLAEIRERDIPEILRHYEDFSAEFRKQWIARCKYSGMETVQVRIGGLQARYQELGRRIEEYLSGKEDVLSELEVLPDIRCNPGRERYIDLAASGVF